MQDWNFKELFRLCDNNWYQNMPTNPAFDLILFGKVSVFILCKLLTTGIIIINLLLFAQHETAQQSITMWWNAILSFIASANPKYYLYRHIHTKNTLSNLAKTIGDLQLVWEKDRHWCHHFDASNSFLRTQRETTDIIWTN